MGTTNVETLSPAEREQIAAGAERTRQLRRRAGAPDAMTAAEAIARHLPSAEELGRAGRDDPDPRAPTAATQEAPRGIS